MKTQVKRSEIESEFFGCVYCGAEGSIDDGGHCSESAAHYSDMVQTVDGDWHVAEEIEIVD